jgi:hypothetical protein
MHDILPLPSAAVPYDGALAGSSGSSSSDSTGDEDVDMEMDEPAYVRINHKLRDGWLIA